MTILFVCFSVFPTSTPPSHPISTAVAAAAVVVVVVVDFAGVFVRQAIKI